MGILSRFRDIMASNINALLDRAQDPEKVINEYMRSLNSDLGNIKAETASILADERRAKSVLGESEAEIRKLQKYAEKCVAEGEEEKALRFLEKKAAQTEKHKQLQAAYDKASANAAAMQKMHDKIVSDLAQVEARYAELKGKMQAVKAQQQENAGKGVHLGNVNAALDAAEEKVNQSYYEAMALAELREEASKKEDDLDELIAQLEKKEAPADTGAAPSPEDELAALKQQMNK